MPHQELIDFMARPDFEELSTWVSDYDGKTTWIAIAATGAMEENMVHARVTSRTGPLDAMLMAIARHRAMEGGNE